MDKARAAAPLSDADIETIPVKLVIELGQIDSTLGELSSLAPGSVLPLSRPLGEAAQLVANGKRIGYGALVRIGDSLGIRVTRLVNS